MTPPEQKPRTFSLARLMAIVTLVCVVCGLGVNFPRLAQIYLVVLVVVLPVMLVHFMFARMVTNTNQLAVIVCFGFIVGMFLESPSAYWTSRSSIGLTGFGRLLAHYAAATIQPTIVAIFLAACYVVIVKLFSEWSDRNV